MCDAGLRLRKFRDHANTLGLEFSDASLRRLDLGLLLCIVELEKEDRPSFTRWFNSTNVSATRPEASGRIVTVRKTEFTAVVVRVEVENRSDQGDSQQEAERDAPPAARTRL